MHISEEREFQEEEPISKKAPVRVCVLGILRTRRWYFDELVTEIPPTEPLIGDPVVDGK